MKEKNQNVSSRETTEQDVEKLKRKTLELEKQLAKIN